MTMPEMHEHIKFTGAFAKTEFAKNLFYQDGKKKDKRHLIIAADSTTIDIKAMWGKLGVAAGNMSAGRSEEVMEKLLGVKKGGVTLFSIVNDVDNQVKLIVDKRLWDDFEYVGFHPMVNTATTSISREDMKKVIELSGHEPTIIDFSDGASGTVATGQP